MLDADAIVLDFSFQIEDIAQEFPTADIIASADLRMGLINTGVMIIRNSAWSRSFLSRWWTIADRKVVCDQDAFDVLYKTYLEEEKLQKPKKGKEITSKVRVLAMDRINSHPPAMLHQQPHNPILHLMGESTVMRSTVFKTATETLCQSLSTDEPLPAQLRITRKFLLDTARYIPYIAFVCLMICLNSVVYKAEVDQRLLEAGNFHSAGPADFDKLSLSAHHYTDILEHKVERLEKEKTSSSDDQRAQIKQWRDEISLIRQQIWKLSLDNAEYRKQAIGARTPDQTVVSDAESMTNFALMLKRAAEAGNDVYRSMESYEDKKKVGKQVLKICDVSHLYMVLHYVQR